MVSTYVKALGAHDLPRARALLTPRWLKILESEVDSPFTNTVSITNLRIYEPQPGESTLGSARRHRLVLYVPVHFDLVQRKAISMPDGPTTWGYVVVRDTRKAPWRIDGEGL